MDIEQPVNRNFTRREFLSVGAMAGAGLVIMSGCGGSSGPQTGGGGGAGYSGPSVELDFWNGLTGGDGPYMVKLIERFNSQNENINAPEGYVDADVEFHNLLARSARNRVFLMMMEPIVDLLLASRRLTGSKEANAKRALRAHEAILKKVEAKDVEGARMEMRKHMMTTEHDMRATIAD